MSKLNCWEFKKCGRQPGGDKVGELGVCPATELSQYDGLNGGVNGGRYCWKIAGTLCKGEIQGTFAKKRSSCNYCDFCLKVKKDEGAMFQV